MNPSDSQESLTPVIDEMGIDGAIMRLCQECITNGIRSSDNVYKAFWTRRASDLLEVARKTTEDLDRNF